MGIGGPKEPATERDDDNTTSAALDPTLAALVEAHANRPEDGDSESVVDPALAALVEAHARVMQGYARVLGQASLAGRDPLGERKSLSQRLSHGALFGPLVRLLARTHIRRRLDELAACCAQLELQGPRDLDETRRDWLQNVRDDAQRAAATLPSLRLPGVFVLVPVLFGIVTGVAKLSFDGAASTVWFFVLLVVISVGGPVYRDLVIAYRHKRRLMLPDAKTVDRLSAEQQRTRQGENLYRDEADLFAQLGFGSPRELEVDALAIALGPFLLAESVWIAPLLIAAPDGVSMVFLAAGFVVLIVALVVQLRAPKRVWR